MQVLRAELAPPLQLKSKSLYLASLYLFLRAELAPPRKIILRCFFHSREPVAGAQADAHKNQHNGYFN